VLSAVSGWQGWSDRGNVQGMVGGMMQTIEIEPVEGADASVPVGGHEAGVIRLARVETCPG